MCLKVLCLFAFQSSGWRYRGPGPPARFRALSLDCSSWPAWRPLPRRWPADASSGSVFFFLSTIHRVSARAMARRAVGSAQHGLRVSFMRSSAERKCAVHFRQPFGPWPQPHRVDVPLADHIKTILGRHSGRPRPWQSRAQAGQEEQSMDQARNRAAAWAADARHPAFEANRHARSLTHIPLGACLHSVIKSSSRRGGECGEEARMNPPVSASSFLAPCSPPPIVSPETIFFNLLVDRIGSTP